VWMPHTESRQPRLRDEPQTLHHHCPACNIHLSGANMRSASPEESPSCLHHYGTSLQHHGKADADHTISRRHYSPVRASAVTALLGTQSKRATPQQTPQLRVRQLLSTCEHVKSAALAMHRTAHSTTCPPFHAGQRRRPFSSHREPPATVAIRNSMPPPHLLSRMRYAELTAGLVVANFLT
jgi:hypothetical protein